jgi:RNA polymerase-binding transcription factor
MPGAGKKERRSGTRSLGGRVRAAVARARPGVKPAAPASAKPVSKAARPAPRAAKPAPKRPAPKKPAAKAAKPASKAKKPAPVKAQKKAPAKKAVPKKAVAKKATAKAPAKATAKAARPAAKTTAAAKAAPASPAGRTATATKAATPLAVTRALAGETKPKAGKKTVICPLSGFEVTPGPANLSPKTLERLRQKLIDEKDRLRHQAEELSAEAEQLAREREAGDTQFDEESGEGDTVNIERERDLLLSATARQVVEEIDDALERIKRNKYGVCKPAGRKIAVERLEAIPWAQVCVDCKARAERRR